MTTAADGIRNGNPLLLASKTLYPQLKTCFATHYLNPYGVRLYLIMYSTQRQFTLKDEPH